jgi:hypothetical protein
MSEPRAERRLSIWNKVAECEQALEKIYLLNTRVDRLITLERLFSLKREMKNP